MLLNLYRYTSDENTTLGLLTIDGKFAAYTLEDAYRETKIEGITRIPAGTYRIKTRMSPSKHKEMLWLQDVPGFEYIYIHEGNLPEDTQGCILIGFGVNVFLKKSISDSRSCYNKITPPIFKAIKRGDDVIITIHDENRA